MGKLRRRAVSCTPPPQLERSRSSLGDSGGWGGVGCGETHHFCPHGGKSAEKRGRVSIGQEEQASDTPSPVVPESRAPSPPPPPGRRPGGGRAFQAAAPLPRAPLAMRSSACADKRAHHPVRPGVGPEPSAHVSHPQAAARSHSLSWEAATHLTPPPGPLEGLVFSREGGLNLNRGVCQGSLEAWRRDHAPGNGRASFFGVWGVSGLEQPAGSSEGGAGEGRGGAARSPSASGETR